MGPRLTHARFHLGYIWMALAFAMTSGFALGAHLAAVLGLGFPVGQGFISFLQTHGHVQLVGWAGGFIMGISLHVMPRLASVPIAQPRCLPWILGLMASGLGVRSVGQTLGPYLTYSTWYAPVLWLTAISGLLEWGGVVLYVSVLVRTVRGGSAGGVRPALSTVRPYAGMMVVGWLLYASLNLVLLVSMACSRELVVHQDWNQWAIQSFIGLVLLPVAFIFSVRTLPHYLHLPPPTWPVRGTAYAYLAALTCQLLPRLPPLAHAAPHLTLVLTSLGMLGNTAVVVWVVWHLGVLTRRRAPWTAHRQRPAGSDGRLTRSGRPDSSEFGCFEQLISAAYTWLIVAVLWEALAAVLALCGSTAMLHGNAARHLYLLGFITLLIFGMAVRMLPGFLQKKRVASPVYVTATYWLGNAATLCRALLFMLPLAAYTVIPGSLTVARMAFAVSGLLGLGAVVCLAINLWKTAHTS